MLSREQNEKLPLNRNDLLPNCSLCPTLLPSMIKKGKLHPRNRHQGHYDFKALMEVSPELKNFIAPNHRYEESLDFSDPAAVKALNRALLLSYYGIVDWDIPDEYLCPPIPGRADYIHGLADLLSYSNDKRIPTGSKIRVLDIGVGANCVYPIVGHSEYGWSFVGADIDPGAFASSEKILNANPKLKAAVELRRQPKKKIFKGIIQKDELWCEGGEVAFITQMIEESFEFQSSCLYFSSFVSKGPSMEPIEHLLRTEKIEWVVQSMEQGQKHSRFIAWTFMDKTKRKEWAKRRFS